MIDSQYSIEIELVLQQQRLHFVYINFTRRDEKILHPVVTKVFSLRRFH